MTQRPHRKGRDFQTPERDSKGWNRIIARGCGGYTDYWGEFYCRHEYACACEECPIGILADEKRELEWFREMMQIQGPPRNLKHPAEYWYTPDVGAELVWCYGNDESEYLRMVQAAMELPPKEKKDGGDFILGDRSLKPCI